MHSCLFTIRADKHERPLLRLFPQVTNRPKFAKVVELNVCRPEPVNSVPLPCELIWISRGFCPIFARARRDRIEVGVHDEEALRL